MPTASATSPMTPPSASTSRTRCPLATPPMAGLQLIWAIRSRFMVMSAVLRPMRAAAIAASQPACPAPTTATSYCSIKAIRSYSYGNRFKRAPRAVNGGCFYNGITAKNQALQQGVLVRMRYCSCGNVAVEGGAECTRCRSLRALGLQVGATDSQIRSAYHVLVKVWHPDRFQHDPLLITQADEKLKSINTAFQYLTSAAAKQEQRQRSQATRDSSGDAPSAVPTPESKPRGVKSFA